jgi:preprotein translocase subunit SecA
LEYDDVLNQQRRYIYEQRDAILSDPALTARIHDAAGEMVDAALADYREAQRRDGPAALKDLAGFLKSQFGYTLSPDLAGEARNSEALKDRILGDLRKDMDEKEALVGAENLNSFIRMQYLQAIDRKWLDHLENMEGLREAVYLRSYGQKNPLTEYKLEGFQIFDAMIDTIRREIASRFYLMRIQQAGDRTARSRQGPAVQSASHGSVGAFSAAGGGGRKAGPSNRSEPEAATVVRTYPKVGRNDPCPCGSGKKYKFCHGR